MARAAQKNTVERILKKSLQLFNRHGVQNVAVYNIASELKISPGNLTYHFKKKNDIILLLMEEAERRLHKAVEVEVSVEGGILDFARRHVEIHRLLSDNRFFFNDFVFLAADSEELRDIYLRFKKTLIDRFIDHTNKMVTAGVIRPLVSPNSPELLAENAWAVVMNEIRAFHLEKPGKRQSKKDATFNSLRHHWALLAPYLDEKTSRAVYDSFLKVLD